MLKILELPYHFNALEPYYSEETLRLHYNILYKGYVDNTNKTQEQLQEAREKRDFSNIKCLEKNLSFFGSGAILHELFFENFKAQFEAAATNVEASGWCLLVWVSQWNKLEILQCEKHQDLTLWGCLPILVLDMWEHSYYLQYKTERPKYIQAFWNIVNWNVINRRWNLI